MGALSCYNNIIIDLYTFIDEKKTLKKPLMKLSVREILRGFAPRRRAPRQVVEPNTIAVAML